MKRDEHGCLIANSTKLKKNQKNLSTTKNTKRMKEKQGQKTFFTMKGWEGLKKQKKFFPP
jgi:hypothetical protein